jgi:hypothetical protein
LSAARLNHDDVGHRSQWLYRPAPGSTVGRSWPCRSRPRARRDHRLLHSDFAQIKRNQKALETSWCIPHVLNLFRQLKPNFLLHLPIGRSARCTQEGMTMPTDILRLTISRATGAYPACCRSRTNLLDQSCPNLLRHWLGADSARRRLSVARIAAAVLLGFTRVLSNLSRHISPPRDATTGGWIKEPPAHGDVRDNVHRLMPTAHQYGSCSEKRTGSNPAAFSICSICCRVKRCSSRVQNRS